MTCLEVPFRGGEYCYGPLFMDFWDKAFYVVLITALIAIAVNQIHERYK